MQCLQRSYLADQVDLIFLETGRLESLAIFLRAKLKTVDPYSNKSEITILRSWITALYLMPTMQHRSVVYMRRHSLFDISNLSSRQDINDWLVAPLATSVKIMIHLVCVKSKILSQFYLYASIW